MDDRAIARRAAGDEQQAAADDVLEMPLPRWLPEDDGAAPTAESEHSIRVEIVCDAVGEQVQDRDRS
ncbi:MAG: hypothetical protein AAF628_28600 [Planctomycetota bacterium]